MAVVQCTVDSEPPAELALARNGKVLATSNGIPGLAVETGHVQVARNALRLRVQAVPSAWWCSPSASLGWCSLHTVLPSWPLSATTTHLLYWT